MNEPFEIFGTLGNQRLPAHVKSGRLQAQAEAERLIVGDIEQKLSLRPRDRLLEIGCGVGNLLVPLSFRVARAVGIDHAGLIEAARERFRDVKVEFRSGQFPGEPLDEKFDRVLVYSVIHYLANFEAICHFIDAAAALVLPGGSLLVGDIPNTDRKARFTTSDAGELFEAEWRQRVSEDKSEAAAPLDALTQATFIRTLNDDMILALIGRYRSMGFHAYVLPQPSALPFGHTREDILLVRL
jgi:cyclopropane fatty-acyl-phospholipid synthase-like methyltransferase